MKGVKFLISLILSLSPLFSSSESFFYPLSSSLGGSGRAGSDSAEYHLINAATLLNGKSYQLSGMYFFNKKSKIYGGTLLSTQDLPFAFTWIKKNNQNYRSFSIAGKLSKKMFIGVSIHNKSKNHFHPHLGFIYQPLKKWILGFTSDHLNQSMRWGLGSRVLFSTHFALQGDVEYYQNHFTYRGGLEFITKDSFSLRLGSLWPDSSFRLGLSFNGYPIKIDYTWIQSTGHSFGFRIEQGK